MVGGVYFVKVVHVANSLHCFENETLISLKVVIQCHVMHDQLKEK